MENEKYYKRISDGILDLKLRAFGATKIVGPKWCGKTETAKQRAKSKIMLQRDSNKDGLIYTAKINPMALLDGDQPRLIDDGRYALIELKLGSIEIDDGANNLNKLEKLIVNDGKLRKPDLKIIITGTKYGYKRDDGVFVVPIGCLKN